MIVVCDMQQIAKRRAALASAHLEAGQGFWLAKQRWLWRRGRLSREQFLMLQLAGLEMDIDPPLQWKRLAHETAHYLHGSQIHPDQVYSLPHACFLLLHAFSKSRPLHRSPPRPPSLSFVSWLCVTACVLLAWLFAIPDPP